MPSHKALIRDVKKQLAQLLSQQACCTASVLLKTRSLGLTESKSLDGFHALPEDILVHILSCFANRNEAAVVRGVCKTWRDVFDQSTRCLAIHTNLALLPQHSAAFPNLRHLVVSHTNNAAVQAAVVYLALPSSKLTSLELSNSLLNAVPSDVHKLTGLKTLVISNSHLRTLSSSYLHLLPLLQHLDLSSNDLCDLPASIGSLGKTLRKLNVSENNLSYLPEGLGGLTVLHTLRASNNLLLELPDALMTVTSLTQLDLSYNRLKELPDKMVNLTNLRQLSLFAGFSHSLKNEGSGTVKALAQLTLDVPQMHLQAEEGVLALVKLRRKQLKQAAEAAAGAD